MTVDTTRPLAALYESARTEGEPARARDAYVARYRLGPVLRTAHATIRACPDAADARLDLTLFEDGGTPALELMIDVPRDQHLYETVCRWDFAAYVQQACRPGLEACAEQVRAALAAAGHGDQVLVGILY